MEMNLIESREDNPLVSVIIPTRNSGKTLNLCLQSIATQTYQQIEVMVVDGGSMDETVAIAQKHKAKVITCKVGGRTHARNVGASHASGEFLLFIDSDEVLPPKLVEECIDIVLNGRVEVIFLSQIDTGLSYFGKSRQLAAIMNLKLRGEINVPNSLLRFYSKKAFEQLNGYDEDLVFAEDFIQALKCFETGFISARCKVPLMHYPPEKLRNIFLKRYSYGKTFRRYKEKASTFGTRHTLVEYFSKGFFYIWNISKLPDYGRYIPGFFMVKLIEMLGLRLGNLLSS